MAIFDNNLTPEEKEADFVENEVDNDTFYIEQLDGKYPENLSDYDPSTFLNSETETNADLDLTDNETTDNETTDLNNEFLETYNIDNQENISNIEDNLEESILPETINNTNTANDDITISDVFDMEQNDITNDNLQTNTDEDNDKVEIDNNNNNINEDISNVEEIEKSDNQQNTIFDSDFLNLLKNDISKYKEKTEAIEKKRQAERQDNDSILYGNSIDIDTSQSPEELQVDLMSMEINAKNNANKTTDDISDIMDDFSIIDENNDTNEITNDTNEINNDTDNIISDVVEEKNMTEKEKQNNKKTFALIIAIVSIAMILIVGGIIGYLYLSSKKNIPNQPQNAEHTEQDTTTAVSEEITEHTEQDTTTAVSEEITEQDTIIKDTTEQDAIIKDTAKVISAQPKPKTGPKYPTQKSVNKTTSIATTNVPSESHTTKMQGKGTLYTIQIYSSPVKSDAEKRLTLLSQKGITGYITEQNIKGEIWYRVRFGSFEKYEDAKNTIEKYGIKDVWIERIR